MLTHKFVSPKADGPDATKLRPSNWNEEHKFTGGATGSALIRDTGATDGASWQTKPVLDARDYGVTADGATDDTATLQAACTAAIGRTLKLPGGTIRLATAGGIVLTGNVLLVGDGVQSTTILRAFSPASDAIGAINLNVRNGSGIRDLAIVAATGTTGGCLISIVSTAATAAGFMRLCNLDLTFQSVNTYKYALYVDGSAKTGAPIGARDLYLSDVVAFGGTSGSAYFKGVVACTWMGGGAYAGGSTSGSVTVTGDATVTSQYVTLSISSIAGLTLDYVAGITLLGYISGNLTNTVNTSFASVVGTISGTVQANWVSSQMLRNGQLLLKPLDATQALQIGSTSSTDTLASTIKSGSTTQVNVVGSPGAGFAVATNLTFTFTTNSGPSMFILQDNNGKSGLFFATNNAATVTILSDPSGYFENSATPTAGKWGVFKSGSSNVVSVINKVGSTQTIHVLSVNTISSTSDPA